MQTYARINADGQVTQWPVLEHHIKARGLPMRFFEPVIDRPAPDHDSLTHAASKRWPVRDDAGRLVQAWEIEPRTIEAIRQDQIDRLAAYRWQRETGGVDLPTGQQIATTREAQAQIGSTFNALSSGLIPSVEWKAGGGWITLDLNHFGPIAQAVAGHVQKCFAAEKIVSQQIESAVDIAELVAIEITAAFNAAYSESSA